MPPQQLLLEAISVVENLHIPYAIMGGFAVRSWGVPRPTYDADLAVSVDSSGMQRLLDALEDQGFDVPTEHRRGFLDIVAGLRKAKVTRFVDRSVWDVDVFVAQGGLLESAISRARDRTLSGITVRVMAPEDVILLKLMAFRRKDQLDVEEVIKICTALDTAYLNHWASRLGVADRLAEFLPDQGSPP